MNDEELLRRLAALRKHGATEQELAAFADEWDRTHKRDLTTAKPDVLTGEGMGGPLSGGNNPFGSAVRTGMGTVLGMGVGGLAGAGVAAMLPKQVAQAVLGRVLAGAAGGVGGGVASRAVTTPGSLMERGRAAVNPMSLAIDATLGGALGGLFSATPGSKQTASDLGETIPRVVRKGTTADMARAAGVPLQEPLAAQNQMTSAMNAADAQRFAFMNNGGGVVTDPKVLAEYANLKTLFPELEGIALRSAQLDAASKGLPFDPEQISKNPDLRFLHYVKQTLAKPEALAEARALAEKPLGKTDLRSIKKIAAGFRDVLKNYSPEYKSAVEASQADRVALGALESGANAAKGASKSLGANPTSPEAIAQTAAGLTTPAQQAAQKTGFVGQLSLAEDPLKKIDSGVVRDKLRALLTPDEFTAVDRAMTPWENADKLSGKLKDSGMGLASRFGFSSALGGDIQAAKTGFGGQLLNVLTRGSRIREASKLAPLFQSHAPGSDTEDFMAILNAFAKARAAQAVRAGGAAGILAGGTNQRAVAPWENPE